MPAQTDTQRSKTALVLAGGGLSGAVYELGALQALDERLSGLGVTDFDIFVGTSAGALVAGCLANGLAPRTMMRSLETTIDGVPPLRFDDIFALDAAALLAQATVLPRAVFGTLRSLLASRGQLSLLDVIESLALAMPNGLYDSRALERYLTTVFARPGLTNEFTTLSRELAIIATDLDSGERVVFGIPPHDRTPIAQAVAASTAVPLVYRPMRIDGRDYIDGGIRGNASVDLAIELGARLVVCINPLVPYDYRPLTDQRRVGDMGAPAVLNQAFRTLASAGLHYHLKQLQRRHPDVDVVLIEPTRDDLRMSFEMPMRYASRIELARHGYESVAAQLSARYDEYAALLARHGVSLDQPTPAGPPAGKPHADLRTTLDALDRVLAGM